MKWYQITILIIILILVIVIPGLLMSPEVRVCLGISDLDFVGGVISSTVVPFLSLASTLILFWTLRAQQQFNAEQRNNNAINQLLALQGEIISMGDRIQFVYIGDNHREQVANGYKSLALFESTSDDKPHISIAQLRILLNQLEVLIKLLKCYDANCRQSKITAAEYVGFPGVYCRYVRKFLQSVCGHRIPLVSSILDIQSDVPFGSERSIVINEASSLMGELNQMIRAT